MSEKDLIETVRQMRELQRMAEEAQAEAEKLRDRIKAFMGSREELTAGDYRISWKTVTSARIDTAALKKELPDVAALFTRETVSRRFAVA